MVEQFSVLCNTGRCYQQVECWFPPNHKHMLKPEHIQKNATLSGSGIRSVTKIKAGFGL